MRGAAAVLLTALLCGCVSLRFDRRRGFEPVDAAVLDELRANRADLTACLQRLGAPNLVREQPDGRIALVWAWLDQFGWGINVSVNVRNVALSTDVDRNRRHMKGAVLFFDDELRLVDVDCGLLRDFLTLRDRRRPDAPED
ncbi:MAG TPA: hypothetical protein VK081_07080 [Planctomycetota bacterium]|nr:hypothetical protein [Planctomycetota bacterium]